MRQAKELTKLSVKRTNFISKRELFLLVGYHSGYHLVNYQLCVCPRLQSASSAKRTKKPPNTSCGIVQVWYVLGGNICKPQDPSILSVPPRKICYASLGKQNSFCHDRESIIGTKDHLNRSVSRLLCWDTTSLNNNNNNIGSRQLDTLSTAY